jgi:hypothetical protein
VQNASFTRSLPWGRSLVVAPGTLSYNCDNFCDLYPKKLKRISLKESNDFRDGASFDLRSAYIISFVSYVSVKYM